MTRDRNHVAANAAQRRRETATDTPASAVRSHIFIPDWTPEGLREIPAYRRCTQSIHAPSPSPLVVDTCRISIPGCTLRALAMASSRRNGT